MTLDKNAYAAISELYEHYEDENLDEKAYDNLVEAEDVFTSHDSDSYLDYCTLIQLAGILKVMGEPVPCITKTIATRCVSVEKLASDLRNRVAEALTGLNLNLGE